MDILTTIDAVERSKIEMQVNTVNTGLENGRIGSGTLDKDDFLKVLITQLTHQDPTQPLEDKEFIAQMAQFSTLEQMTNMNNEFSRLSGMLAANQALALLGKTVDLFDGQRLVTGVVEEVAGKDLPQVLVNGRFFDYSQIEKIRK